MIVLDHSWTRYSAFSPTWLVTVLALLLAASTAKAQEPAEVLSFDADGRISVRATRLTGDFDLDGRLEESIYEQL